MLVFFVPKPPVATGASDRGLKCGWIVAVDADIEAQIGLRPRLQHMRNCRGDDVGFLPGRHKDRKGSVQVAVLELGPLQARRCFPTGQPEPEPAAINREVIKRPHEEKDPGKQKQFMLEDCQPLPQIQCNCIQGYDPRTIFIVSVPD